MDKKVSVIVPTYKEKENVSPLVERIDKTLKGYDYEVVFVDDNSPDGTADAIKVLATKYPVRVIVRTEERGLATAVIRGFKEAAGDVLVVIDADLQHPPEVIPSLLNEIEKGADIAIPSRYVAGGGCEGWGLMRRIMSKGAILMSHLALPSIKHVSDPMSGFFALRRETVSNADLRPIGYKILLEILIMGHYKGVAEVPYVFRVREKGQSKLSAHVQIDYIKQLFDLMKRSGELIRFIKFCIVGGSGVIVNEGLYWILTRFTGLHNTILAANAISVETSIITNFLFNDFFTFADKRKTNTTSRMARFLKFNLISLGGLVLSLGTLQLLTGVFGVFDLLSVLVGVAVATLWNYFANRWWTWR